MDRVALSLFPSITPVLLFQQQCPNPLHPSTYIGPWIYLYNNQSINEMSQAEVTSNHQLSSWTILCAVVTVFLHLQPGPRMINTLHPSPDVGRHDWRQAHQEEPGRTEIVEDTAYKADAVMEDTVRRGEWELSGEAEPRNCPWFQHEVWRNCGQAGTLKKYFLIQDV